MFKLYQCHKQVRAARVEAIDRIGGGTCLKFLFVDGPAFVCHENDPMLARYRPVIGDYLVEYEDGHRSFSPAAAFEKGYTELHECTCYTCGAVFRSTAEEDAWCPKCRSMAMQGSVHVVQHPTPAEMEKLRAAIRPAHIVSDEPHLAPLTSDEREALTEIGFFPSDEIAAPLVPRRVED